MLKFIWQRSLVKTVDKMMFKCKKKAILWG